MIRAGGFKVGTYFNTYSQIGNYRNIIPKPWQSPSSVIRYLHKDKFSKCVSMSHNLGLRYSASNYSQNNKCPIREKFGKYYSI